MKRYIIITLFTSFVAVGCIKNESRLESEGIVGGKAAKIGQFKYVVSIQSNEYHYCGGCIISIQHVLTAAHCIIDVKENFKTDFEITIVAGVIEAMSKSRTALRLKVKKAYVPREFTRNNPNPRITNYRETGDIAVLKLAKPFGSRNRAVTILKLPTGNPSFVDTHPIVMGYGFEEVRIEKNLETNKNVEIPVIKDFKLKYGETTVLTQDVCQAKHKNIIHPSHMCAHMKQRDGEDAGVCLGDSGGPLILNGDTVIGVVSYSPFGCKENNAPSIYTRVTSFLTFLNKAKNDEDSPDIRTHIY